MDKRTQAQHVAKSLMDGKKKTCDGKYRYSAEYEAVREAIDQSLIRSRKLYDAYPCPFCYGWHIGLSRSSKDIEGIDPLDLDDADLVKPPGRRLTESDGTEYDPPNTESWEPHPSECVRPGMHHSWDQWMPTRDPMNPPEDGFWYKTECLIAGCTAEWYAERLMPLGRRKVVKK